MNELKRMVLFLLLIAMTICVPAKASDTVKMPLLNLKGIRILVCAGYWGDMTGMPCLRRLTDAGAEVRRIRRPELTWELVRQYHLIIYIFDHSRKGGDDPDKTLCKFVQSGGGVMFIPTPFESKDAINQMLAPFGAIYLNEFIQDRNTFTNTSAFYHLTYAYTDNISSNHSITKNIKRICYNAANKSTLSSFKSLFSTSAIDVNKDWDVLVSGKKSATTFKIVGTTIQGREIDKNQLKTGKYTHAPPFIAARQYGKGAAILMGLSGIEIFYGQGLPHYGDVVMEKGDGLYRSDFGRIYNNALVWLARYGRNTTELGKGDLKQSQADKLKKIDWKQDVLAGQQCTRPSKGVIGLHSTLSDGKATPQALIAKAKAIGLQWVAFTEKLEYLADDQWNKRTFDTKTWASAGSRNETFSPDKWEQLRKICREASTGNFTALPGIDYADNTGDRWVAYGDFEWPPKKVFSSDRKKIIDPMWQFSVGLCANGPYNCGNNHLRPWDYSMYNHWAIFTSLNGKRTDNALDAFRYLQGIQDDPSPMAVDMVYDEEGLEKASQKMCNYLMIDKPGDLTKFFRDTHYFGSWRSFVSDGPIVTDWRCANGCRSTNGKWHVPATERYRVKLSVESETTVDDIKIYDGPVLFRRFRPKHPKVTVTFNVPHDQQRNLLAFITDANGKQAVTGAHFIRDLLNFRFMCADRGNSICDAVITDEFGSYLTGPSAPYQRKMDTGGIFPGYGLRPFRIGPPGVDGGMRPLAMSICPPLFYHLTMDPKRPNWWPKMETRMEIPVCSRDGILQEDTVTGYFATRTDAWAPKLKPIDIKNVILSYRYLNITPRATDPGVILLEGRIQFNKNTCIKGEALDIFSLVVHSKPGEGDHYAMITPEKTVMGQHQIKSYSATAQMEPGSYVMVFPAQLGSSGAMALDKGYRATVSDGQRTRIAVRIDKSGNMKAGEEIRYRLLLIHGRQNELANNDDWEMFAIKMGIRGKPAYKVQDVKTGKVKGMKFLLEIEPQDGGFAATIPYANLPIRLPVRVANMNPNWTFAWLDLDRKEWFPSAVDPVIKQGFFTINTRRGTHRFFAGHPVLADNKNLRIAVFSDGRSKIQANINNVGDKAMDTIIRLNPALGKAEPVKIHLESGDMKNLKFKFTP